MGMPFDAHVAFFHISPIIASSFITIIVNALKYQDKIEVHQGCIQDKKFVGFCWRIVIVQLSLTS